MAPPTEPGASKRTAWGLIAWVQLLLIAGCASGHETRRPAVQVPNIGARVTRSFVASTTGLLKQEVEALSTRRGRSDTLYFRSGVWYGDASCWRCGVAPGMVAAVLTRAEPSNKTYRMLAIETFDHMIAEHQATTGEFVPHPASDYRGEETTIAAATYLATAYLELGKLLPAADRKRWRGAVQEAANWMRPAITYYVNGNVNSGEALQQYLSWRVTGNPQDRSTYDRSLAFTLDPSPRWRGFGLQYLRRPKRADGSDGSAYLAEEGPRSKPGFDPYYMTLTLGHFSLLYALSRSTTALRTLNLLTNAELARTNTASWMLSNVAGSRTGMRGSASHQVPFISPALPVLALAGQRLSLQRKVMSQFRQVRAQSLAAISQNSPQETPISEFADSLIALDPPQGR